MDTTPVAAFVELLEGTALLGFGALLYGVVAARLSGRTQAVVLGLLFGAGAVVTMADPVVIAPGVLFDSRTTLVLVSGLFGGPLAATLCGAIAALYRITVGGVGTAAGLVTIAGAVLIAVGAAAWARRSGGPRAIHILALSLTAPLLSLGIFALPYEHAVGILTQTFVPLTLVRVSGVLFLGFLILHEHRRIEAEREVRRLAFADELSGLDNRRAFYLHLDQAWERWRRYREPFAVMLVDIDRFKSINDRFGHPVGDEVIRTLGIVLREELRAADVAARIGGEEFAILLTRATSRDAALVAERVRAHVGSLRLRTGASLFGVTVSIGVAADTVDHLSAQDGLSSADRALYEAKRAGRDRVVVTHTVAVPLHPPRRAAPAGEDQARRGIGQVSDRR